ncbi:MAG: D-glycero-beta-D-manno-heptose 1-phosphate adenylyltransferase [Planctomycetota bacterium]|nr:D-glycero-beta-D-manno-heptose 1-phosphate adenylyltransferase [Planctomycetota bacterium]MDA1179704.1 D-glycero-beta-D-manno-heptose 1-phosphate adenylyltransferase [Planctomycetota bacterium]
MELSLALERLTHPRILVVGDVMLDRYIWGDVSRVSQEAPILILNADQQEDRLGGAANVANMLSALEAQVTIAGIMGHDSDGEILRGLLRTSDIDAQALLNATDRRTTVKQRFVGRASGKHSGQVLRVDYESRHTLPTQLEEQFQSLVCGLVPQYDAVLISDYGKGVCSVNVIEAIIRRGRQTDIPVLVDPARNGDYKKYSGSTLLKPNRYEAAHASRLPLNHVSQAAKVVQHLQKTLQIDNLVITMDREGMIIADQNGSLHHLPSHMRDVYDITGAGDMAFTLLGLGLASGLSLPLAAGLANVAAGWEVQHDGVAVISRHELAAEIQRNTQPKKIQSLMMLNREVKRLKSLGKKIVFTNGCFDLLHVGHVTYLQEAARMGDALIVAVNSDKSVRKLKGPTRPVIQEADRAAMLAALACVNHVLIFEEDTPCSILQTLQPDVLVKGGTYRPDEVVGHEIVTGYGGQVCLTSVVNGVSTTQILESLHRAA